MTQDVRYAIRSLGRARAFTAGAVVTLALGIGANSTIFALASGALFRPMRGIAAPERVVWLSSVDRDGRLAGLSYPDYIDYRDLTTGVFAELAGYRNMPMSLGSGGAPERVRGAAATGSLFPMLGVRTVLGRGLAPADDVAGGPLVAVISDRLWHQRFGGSPDVLRQPLVLSGRAFAVVGVAGPDFRGPAIHDTADVWVPMALMPELRASDRGLLESRGSAWLMVLGRLADGRTVRAAQAAAATVAAELAARHPDVDADRSILVSGAGSPVPPSGRRELIPIAAVLIAVAGLVLVIACANIANLLLARGAARSLELSIRSSLGASRRRLVRQLLTESAVLAAAAGAAGLLLAFWTADLLVSLAGPDLDGLQASPDWRVLLFTIGAAAVSVCAFAVVPAFAATRRQLVPGLRATPSAGGRTRLQGAFVIAQLALSLVLLLAAGLGLRSLQQSTSIDLGFTPDSLTTASFDLVLQNYAEPARRAFREDLLARVRATPGIESVAIANVPPLGGTMIGGGVSGGSGPHRTMAFMNAVTPAYFSTMRIPIVRGRPFTDRDGPGATVAVIVSQALARRFWGDGDPIGQPLQVHLQRPVDAEVVGVARDSKYDDPTERPEPFVYFALAQQPVFDGETLIVRTAAGAAPIGAVLERTIRAMDPALPVYDVHPFSTILYDRVDKQRALSTLFSCFGGLALLLAAVGLYGVMAHGAARRTREFGVRLALGATPSQLAALIARDGLRLGLVGTAIGAAVALPLAKVAGALIFGVQVADVAVVLGVCAVLNAVVLTAALLPARRAARLEPVEALRAE